jgi:hypothetical protein
MRIFCTLKEKVTYVPCVIMPLINTHIKMIPYAAWQLQLYGHETYTGGHNFRYLVLSSLPILQKATTASSGGMKTRLWVAETRNCSLIPGIGKRVLLYPKNPDQL